MLIIVLDCLYGDSGKGKIIDYLVDKNQINYNLRFQGGANAGHTIKVKNETYYTHLLPSGIINKDCICVLGNGMVINVEDLFKELEQFKNVETALERVKIMSNAHITLNIHKLLDKKKNGYLGTTNKGIGPSYADKMSRISLRLLDIINLNENVLKEKLETIYESYINNKLFEDIKISGGSWNVYNRISKERYKNYLNKYLQEDLITLVEYSDKLKKMIINTNYIKKTFSNKNNNILIEGANGLMLDIDHGSYPYVTSSNCSIGGVFTGLGLNLNDISNFKEFEIIGVLKSYVTRIGTGPFPTEQDNEIGKFLLTVGKEYGVTTGRDRRCGYLDLVELKYSCQINGYTCFNITKLDILGQLDTIKICVDYDSENLPIYKTFDNWKDFKMNECNKYEDLHQNIKIYIEFIEQSIGVPIKYINTGANRDEIIIKH
jgi:adenylosuccinate synthase